jgi:signal transduction histidine kinase
VDVPTIDGLQEEIAELRASCARVVAAADEQRRSIERELHDGPMQQLVALGVKIQLADALVVAGSPAAELLDEMLHDVHEALDEARRLAWRVYPSLLLDHGLVEALAATASTIGIPTLVEAADGRLAPELEATIYFCCAELLQRAAEDHGRARVRIRTERDLAGFEATFESADVEEWKTRDLSAVRDRLAAVGGRLVVEVGRDVRISGVVQGVPAEP